MAVLRNNGARYSASGRGAELVEWLPGQEREVTDEQCAYLLETFQQFSVVAVVQAYKPAPVVDKGPDVAAILSNARQAVQDISLGKHDSALAALKAAEGERSKPRRSILKAIKERGSFLGV